MAKHPNFKREKRIIDMKIGESGFIVPWSMWVDSNNDCFLNEGYNVYQSSGGTVQLKITKVNDGYIAFIKNVDHKWSPRPQHGFVGSDEKLCYGKVVGFELNKIDEPLKTPNLREQLDQAIAEENFELAAKLKKQIS